MTARAMDYRDVLDNDQVVAATKTLRCFLGKGRLGSAEFTLHDSSLSSRYTVMTTALRVEPIFKTTPTSPW